MRISLNWLKDYLDLKNEVSVEQLANLLSMAGLEVDGVERLKEKLQGIHLAQIVTKIEDFEHECLLSVLIDGEEKRALAPKAEYVSGSLVGFVPKAVEKFGAQGKLASLAEIGLYAQSSDVLIFAPNSFTDEPRMLADIPEFDDVILSLSITPNRADALSHLGVARELSALLDLPLKAPLHSVREMGGPTHERAAIEIENANECPRYSLRVIQNIKIEPSPPWMKIRLLAAGMRPINNVVDITNFVMLSRGQPLHAFDYDKIIKDNARAKIIVRKAVADERFVALDGKEYKLSADDLVIADKAGPIALAGVIGGARCAVSEHTTTVLLESAYFEPSRVRLSSRRLGISTESSYRFERGADPNGVVEALNYAARLLVENCDGKSCREVIDAYRKHIDPLELKMRLDRAQQILGINVAHFDEDALRRKFLKLGIETVGKTGDAMYFRVPTFRPDLVREIDLIEEAARMIGYDKIAEQTTHEQKEGDLFEDRKVENNIAKIRQRLLARGFSEAINYAFLSREFHEHFITPATKPIAVLNPLSERYGVMRMSLVPGLIKNLVHNQRNQEKSIQLFELGTVFLGVRDKQGKPEPSFLEGTLDQDSFAIEKQYIAGAMCGSLPEEAFDAKTPNYDFYHLKGVVSECFQAAGLNLFGPQAKVIFRQGSKCPYLHPGESVEILVDETTIGHMGKLHPGIGEALDVGAQVYLFELDLSLWLKMSAEVRTFVNFSRFPVISRDLAILADEALNIDALVAPAYDVPKAEEYLGNVRIFDIYRGKNIPEGKKSVAISLTLQKNDGTLTDEEAESFVSGYLKLLKERTGAGVRLG